MDFSNPLLSLLMLSVSTASCGMSLRSWVATTQRRIFFHLCFYLMFWCSVAVNGPFCYQGISGATVLHLIHLRPWWFCKLWSCCPSATPSPKWSLFYSCYPLHFSCPPLHLLQHSTTAKGSETGAPFFLMCFCRKHIRNLYSKKLRQTKSGRAKWGKIALTLSALGDLELHISFYC